MKNQGEIFKKLREFNIKDTRKFILSNNETIYFWIDPPTIDSLCGLNFTANNHSQRREKIRKKIDIIYNGEGLYKFSLITKTNYFNVNNLLFVVFNPCFDEFYADFVFKTQDTSFVVLRTVLSKSLDYHRVNDTKVTLQDVYEVGVNDLDNLLCGRTFAYPIEVYSKKISKKYDKRFKSKMTSLLSSYSMQYGGKFDDEKATRVINYDESKGMVKKI